MRILRGAHWRGENTHASRGLTSVLEVGIKGRNKLLHPTDIVGCNYLSLPASGTHAPQLIDHHTVYPIKHAHHLLLFVLMWLRNNSKCIHVIHVPICLTGCFTGTGSVVIAAKLPTKEPLDMGELAFAKIKQNIVCIIIGSQCTLRK